MRNPFTRDNAPLDISDDSKLFSNKKDACINLSFKIETQLPMSRRKIM